MKRRTKFAGKVKGKKVFVELPPFVPSFHIPEHDEVLTLKIGDFVKLILKPEQPTHPHLSGERMWVQITKRLGPNDWEGITDNDPLFLPVKIGTKVTFHPAAVVDFLRASDKPKFVGRRL